MTSGDGTARRALLVGAGNMGRGWARNLRATPGVELAGGLPTDTDLDRALAAIEPDFVVDVSPPAAHHDVTLAALAAGAAVLGEKPMADSMARARAMVAAAERADRLYMVSQSRRYNPRLAAFRRLLAETGPPAIVTADFFVGARERGHRLTIDQPLLLDMAIHAFDMARYLTGADPVSVLCDAFNPPWSWYRGDACATAIFEMTGGLRFIYRGSWCSEGRHTSWDGEWRASGPNGSATWRGGDDAPVAEIVTARGGFLPETEERRGVVEDGPKGIAGSVRDFLRALDTGEAPPGECHDNIRTLAMAFGAIEAAATGRRVSCRLWGAPTAN
jgi:predicted dehydrogenase